MGFANDRFTAYYRSWARYMGVDPNPTAGGAPAGGAGNYQFNDGGGGFGGDGIVTRTLSGTAVTIQPTIGMLLQAAAGGITLSSPGGTIGIGNVVGQAGQIQIGEASAFPVSITSGDGLFSPACTITNPVDATQAPPNGSSIALFVQGGSTTVDSEIIRIGRSDGALIGRFSVFGAGTNELSYTPIADATGEVGNPTHRWNLIRGVTITAGDLHLQDEARGAHWTLREEKDFLRAINETTGKHYRIPLEEIAAEE